MILLSRKLMKTLEECAFFNAYQKSEEIDNHVLLGNLGGFKDEFLEKGINPDELELVIKLIKQKHRHKKANFVSEGDIDYDLGIPGILLVRMENERPLPEKRVLTTQFTYTKGEFMRDTLHFTLNTTVKPIAGTYEILMDRKHSWESHLYAILIPLKDIILEKEEDIMNYDISDTFMLGDIKLPKSTIIVTGKRGYDHFVAKKWISPIDISTHREIDYKDMRMFIYPQITGDIVDTVRHIIPRLGYKRFHISYNSTVHSKHWTTFMTIHYHWLKRFCELLYHIIKYIEDNKGILKQIHDHEDSMKIVELTRFFVKEQARLTKEEPFLVHNYGEKEDMSSEWISTGQVMKDLLDINTKQKLEAWRTKENIRQWWYNIAGQLKFYAKALDGKYAVLRSHDEDLGEEGLSNDRLREYRLAFSPLLKKAHDAIDLMLEFIREIDNPEHYEPEFRWPIKYDYYRYSWEK